MFDELAEAELKQQVGNLESQIQERDLRIAELRKFDEVLEEMKTEKDEIAEALKDREAEIAYVSDEMTNREQEVVQLKELSDHMDQRLRNQSVEFDREKIEIHEQYKAQMEETEMGMTALETEIGELQVSINTLREREQELVESREAAVQEYEAKYAVLMRELDAHRSQSGEGPEQEFIQSAREEVEGFWQRNRELKAEIQEQHAEIQELNQFVETAHEETENLHAALSRLHEESAGRLAELEGEVSSERDKRQEIEGSYQVKLSGMETQLKNMNSELEKAMGNNEDTTGLREQLVEVERRLKETVNGQQSKNSEIEEVRSELQEKEKELEQLRLFADSNENFGEELSKINMELQEKETERKELEQIVEIAKSEINLLRSKLIELEAPEEERDNSIKNEVEELHQAHQNWMDVATAHIAELEAELQKYKEGGLSGDSEQLVVVEAELDQARTSISHLEAALKREESAIQELVERNLQTQQELADRSTAVENSKSQIGQLQGALREAEAANQELQARAVRLEDEMEDLRSLLRHATEHLQEYEDAGISPQASEDLDAARARVKFLEGHTRELKEEVQVTLMETEEMGKQLTESQTRAEALAQREDDQLDEIEDLQNLLGERTDQIEQIKAKFEAERAEIGSQHEAVMSSLQEKFETACSALNEKTVECQEAVESRRAFQETLQEFIETNQELESLIQEHQAEIRRLQDEELRPSISKNEQLRNEKRELLESITNIHSEKDVFALEVTNLSGRIETAEMTIHEYEDRIGQQDSVADAQNKQIEKATKELNESRSDRYQDRRKHERFRSIAYLANAAMCLIAVGLYFHQSGPTNVTGTPLTVMDSGTTPGEFAADDSDRQIPVQSVPGVLTDDDEGPPLISEPVPIDAESIYD